MGLFYGHNSPILTPARAVNGYLYNWYAASNANFAPTDWKVPTETELQTLSTYLGGNSLSGGKLKENGYTHWDSPNTGADNSSGFTALGSGQRDGIGSTSFIYLKTYAMFWTLSTSGIYGRYMYLSNGGVNSVFVNAEKKNGDSVRLLYTGAGTPTTVTDYDGNVYDTVTIGSQIWTKQNWKCLHYNNGTEIPIVEDGTTWAGLTSGAACAYNNNYGLV